MKNGKRIAAILGIIILLAAAAMPMIFAFDTGEGGAGRFRAAFGAAIMVPILAYVMWAVYRMLGRREPVPESKYKNIVFDVGRVLVDFDWESYLDSFQFPPRERQAMAEHIFQSRTWRERDRGSEPDEYYTEAFLADLPEYREDALRVLKDDYKTIGPRDYAVTWTGYLKKQGYHLYVLSNYCGPILEKTRKHMAFLKYMDGAVFSYQVRQLKPEPEIYRTLLDRYHLKPEETVFLDDTPENCEGARKLGITAIQFKDFKQAAAELEKLGIK